jgi:hypothetical protein
MNKETDKQKDEKRDDEAYRERLKRWAGEEEIWYVVVNAGEFSSTPITATNPLYSIDGMTYRTLEEARRHFEKQYMATGSIYEVRRRRVETNIPDELPWRPVSDVKSLPPKVR